MRLRLPKCCLVEEQVLLVYTAKGWYAAVKLKQSGALAATAPSLVRPDSNIECLVFLSRDLKTTSMFTPSTVTPAVSKPWLIGVVAGESDHVPSITDKD